MGLREITGLYHTFRWRWLLTHPKQLLRFRFTLTCWRCHRVCLLGRLLIGDKKHRPLCATCHQEFLGNLRYELVKAVYGPE